MMIVPFKVTIPLFVSEFFDVFCTSQGTEIVLTDFHISQHETTKTDQKLAGAFVGSSPVGNKTIARPEPSPVPRVML